MVRTPDAARITAALRRQEKLLWSGRADPTAYVQRGAGHVLFATLFSIFPGLILFGLLAGGTDSNVVSQSAAERVVLMIYLAIFSVAAALFLFLSVRSLWTAFRVDYALTTERVLYWTDHFVESPLEAVDWAETPDGHVGVLDVPMTRISTGRRRRARPNVATLTIGPIEGPPPLTSPRAIARPPPDADPARSRATAIDAALEPGERIVWRHAPPLWAVTLAFAFPLAFFLIFAGINAAVVLLILLNGGDTPYWPLPFAGIMMIIGVWSFFETARRFLNYARSDYALTDRRLLALEGDVRAFGPGEITWIEAGRGRRGSVRIVSAEIEMLGVREPQAAARQICTTLNAPPPRPFGLHMQLYGRASAASDDVR